MITRLNLKGERLDYSNGKAVGKNEVSEDRTIVVRDQPLSGNLKSIEGQTKIVVTYDGKHPRIVSR